MSFENKTEVTPINDIDIKEALRKGDIDLALKWLEDKTKEGIDYKRDNNYVSLRFCELQEDDIIWENITKWVCHVLDSYLLKEEISI